MIDANTSDDAPRAAHDEGGVLANLPRTRPQRSSPRRAAARSAAGAANGARKSRPSGDTSAGAGAKRRPSASRKRAPAQRDAAPRQGFECDSETAGGSVQPPGGAELVATAAEIVGELARAGLSTGERVLKDLVSRFPLS